MPVKQLDEEALFHAARRIAAGEARDLFIAQACGGDAGLAERVRALVEMHEQEPESAEQPPMRTFDYEPVAERPGARIGPYRLMEQIGEGGFGLVFVAEQQEPVKRKVALKVIKPGMDTPAGHRPLRGRAAGAGADGPSRTSPGCSTPGRPTPAGRTSSWSWSAASRSRSTATRTSSRRASGWSCSSPSARRCSTPIRRASSTATSSRRTCWSRRTTASRWPRSSTSAWPRRSTSS